MSRLVMEPLRQLLSEQFRVAGTEWAKEQECLVAKAIAAGLDPTKARKYRLAIAASGEDEAKPVRLARPPDPHPPPPLFPDPMSNYCNFVNETVALIISL